MKRFAVIALVACKSKSPSAPPSPPTPSPAPVAADSAPADAPGADASRAAAVEPTWFDEVETFANGRIGVRLGDSWGYVDTTGKIVLPIAYAELGDNAPVTWVRDAAGWEILVTGKLVAIKAKDVTRFADGLTMAKLDDGWHLIGADGKPVLPTIFAKASPLAGCPLWAVTPQEGAPCVIDRRGTCIAAKRIASEPPFIVSDGKKQGVVDCKGAQVVPFAYDEVQRYDDHRQWVRDENGWGLVDRGKLVIPTRLPAPAKESIQDHVELVDKDKRPWLADLAGHVLAPGAWDRVYYLSDGVAIARVAGKWGVVSMIDGKLAGDPAFDEVSKPYEHRVAFRQAGKWGYLDERGQIAIAPTFDRAEAFSDGYALVYTKGGGALIDRAGNFAVKPSLIGSDLVRGGMVLAQLADATHVCILVSTTKAAVVKETAFFGTVSWSHTTGPLAVSRADGCGYLGPRCAELTKPYAYQSCGDFDEAGYAEVTDEQEPPPQQPPGPDEPPPLPPPPDQHVLDSKLQTVATGKDIRSILPGVFEVYDDLVDKGGHAALVVKGVEVVHGGFDSFDDAHDGFVVGKRDNKYALFRLDGTPLVVAGIKDARAR